MMRLLNRSSSSSLFHRNFTQSFVIRVAFLAISCLLISTTVLQEGRSMGQRGGFRFVVALGERTGIISTTTHGITRPIHHGRRIHSRPEWMTAFTTTVTLKRQTPSPLDLTTTTRRRRTSAVASTTPRVQSSFATTSPSYTSQRPWFASPRRGFAAQTTATATALKSSVFPSDGAATTTSTSTAAAASSAPPKVIAEGVIVARFDGVTAVRILDEYGSSRPEPVSVSNNNQSSTSTSPTTATMASSLFTPTPSDAETKTTTTTTTEEMNVAAAANSPPPVASAMTRSSKASPSVNDEDFQGRIVLFPTDSDPQQSEVGVIVAHRPPIVFVYRTGTMTASSVASPTSRTTTQEKDDEEEEAPVGNRVQIVNTRLQVPVPQEKSSSLLLDCLGQPITNAAAESSNDNSIKLPWMSSSSTSALSSPSRAVFAPIPQLKEIALINVPMLTGITMIDTLAPIGRGQNMLFVGHDIQDMRQYTIDFLSHQLLRQQQLQQLQQSSSSSSSSKKEDAGKVACVYAAVDDVPQVEQLLEKQKIRDLVHVVTPTRSTSGDEEDEDRMTTSTKAVLAAATACAMAESLALEKGMHTIVVVDTLDCHKQFWDGTTRVLVDVFGVDAVVQGDRDGGASSEMRAFFSTLVQRAAQFKKNRGAGSITLLLLTKIPRIRMEEENSNEEEKQQEEQVYQESDFENSSKVIQDRIQLLVKRNIPLTAENLRKINIPIPSALEGKRRLILQHVDDLISMSDGQIWLEEKLELLTGQYPSLDPQRSFTRIGIGADTESRADAPAFRQCQIDGLRLVLSQAAAALQEDGGVNSNSVTQKQIRKQQALLLAMHQRSGKGGRTLAESCALLLAATNGYLDDFVTITVEQPTTTTSDQEDGATAKSPELEVIDGLLQHLQKSQAQIMQQVDETLNLLPDQKEILLQSIQEYVAATEAAKSE